MLFYPPPSGTLNVTSSSPGSLAQLYTNLVPFTGTSPFGNPYLLPAGQQEIFYKHQKTLSKVCRCYKK